MTKKINISHVSIPSAVPREYRFAVVADLHDREGARVADLVLSLSPDAVLIPGDLYESPPRRHAFAYEEAVMLLARLTPHVPVFYAPGNHDYTVPAAFLDACERLGVIRLSDSSCEWEGIRIGGVASMQYDGQTPNAAFLSRFAAEEGYKLLLCHHPEYYRHIRPLAVDLTVAGHAHGGQWRIFGRGVFSPGQGLFPRYTAGLYEGRLLVSRGLKISRPIPRLFNDREIILLSLTPPPSPEVREDGSR